MVNKLRPFPQTDKLFFNILIFLGSISLTVRCSKLPAAWTAIPPTPENGQNTLFAPYASNLPHRYNDIGSAMTEYQLSLSNSIPSSNIVKQKYLLEKYLLRSFVMPYFCLSYSLPQDQPSNSNPISWSQKKPVLWLKWSSIWIMVSTGSYSHSSPFVCGLLCCCYQMYMGFGDLLFFLGILLYYKKIIYRDLQENILYYFQSGNLCQLVIYLLEFFSKK